MSERSSCLVIPESISFNIGGFRRGKKLPTLLFIRHGESEGHVGKAATHAEEIGLTRKGKEHAQEIADGFLEAPDLIITSPYLRAKETAAPTLQRFPNTPYHTWQEVREFAYLGSQTGILSTKQERRAMVNDYWNRCDPEYRDGSGESFSQFISRAAIVLERLLSRREGFIVVYTHEQFMRAVQSLLDRWMEKPPEDAHMRCFWKMLLDQPLSNGCMLKASAYSPGENGQEHFLLREKVHSVFGSYAESDDRILIQR